MLRWAANTVSALNSNRSMTKEISPYSVAINHELTQVTLSLTLVRGRNELRNTKNKAKQSYNSYCSHI